MTLEYPAYPGQKRKWCHERRHSDWEPLWINWDFGDMNGYETNSYHYMNHICTPTSCNKMYANQICGCGCIIYRDTLGCSWDVQVSGNPWSKDATMLNKSIQCYYMVNKCKQTWQWKLPILGRSSNWWTFSCHDSLWITETSLAFKWPRLGRLQSPKALTDAREKTTVSWPEKVD